MNSVLIRRDDSDSPDPPRAPVSASTSSMNTIAAVSSRANSNRVRTSFSLSPTHLETRSEELIEKNVESHSVAQALARYDLPVPGGPYSRIPFQGLRLPSNRCGERVGRIS